MSAIRPTYFFTLEPANEAAKGVVAACSPDIPRDRSGRLMFTPSFESKLKNFVVCFGRQRATNDVILPRGFRNDQFGFFFAKSGELVIKERSFGAVDIETAGLPAKQQVLYTMSGLTVRQRVIPRVLRNVSIVCKDKNESFVEFVFGWNPQLCSVENVELQDSLAHEASRRSLSQESHSVPNTRDRGAAFLAQDALHWGSDMAIYKAPCTRSQFTPKLPAPSAAGGLTSSSLNQRKAIHKYCRLGSGSYGEVWKAVDLATGELWAVKEIKEHVSVDCVRDSFKSEVENLAKLDHPYIAKLESFQDFNIGGRLQILYKLCHGNVATLLRRPIPPPQGPNQPQAHIQPEPHNCVKAPTGIPRWALDFKTQTLSAMEYLASERIVHCDIKPENILFDCDRYDNYDVFTFYVSDFGLAISANANRRSGMGTLLYMSPELTSSSSKPNEASDVWAFAVTLGCVLGYWCIRSSCLALSVSQFDSKLSKFGLSTNEIQAVDDIQELEGEIVPNVHTDFKKMHCARVGRIIALVQRGVLPQAFRHMLDAPGARPSFAQCARYSDEDLLGPIKGAKGQTWNFAMAYNDPDYGTAASARSTSDRSTASGSGESSQSAPTGARSSVQHPAPPGDVGVPGQILGPAAAVGFPDNHQGLASAPGAGYPNQGPAAAIRFPNQYQGLVSQYQGLSAAPVAAYLEQRPVAAVESSNQHWGMPPAPVHGYVNQGPSTALAFPTPYAGPVGGPGFEHLVQVPVTTLDFSAQYLGPQAGPGVGHLDQVQVAAISLANQPLPPFPSLGLDYQHQGPAVTLADWAPGAPSAFGAGHHDQELPAPLNLMEQYYEVLGQEYQGLSPAAVFDFAGQSLAPAAAANPVEYQNQTPVSAQGSARQSLVPSVSSGGRRRSRTTPRPT